MRRAVVWGLTSTVGASVVVAFCFHPPQQPSDWASWASAIGTVAAVFAAVWATFAAEDRQHREATQAARITASTIAVMVERLAEEAEEVEASLENLAMNGRGAQTPESLSLKLVRMKGPTEEQLLRLAFAPGQIALTIAEAFVAIQSAVDVLDPSIYRDSTFRSAEWAKDAAREARPIVHSARVDFQKASKKIVSFLDHSAEKG